MKQATRSPRQAKFGRILGWDEVDVSTVAAAQVSPAGSRVCPLPVALPDRWTETDNDDTWDDLPSDVYVPYEEGALEGTAAGRVGRNGFRRVRPRGPAPYSPERDILHIAVGSGNLQSLVHHELGDAQGSGGRSPTRINT